MASMMTLAQAEAPTCGKTHAKVGQTATFSNLQHKVGGKATIIDDCTLEIKNFTYDGQGIDVRIYGAVGKTFDRGFPMTGDLVRSKPYQGETLKAKLPKGKTWDDVTHLSVWCVDFSVDFGNGVLRNAS